ncbi:MAG: hypothetical protein ACI8WA_000675 [Polaribacter sp.]|jgi:hypothetical protein
MMKNKVIFLSIIILIMIGKYNMPLRAVLYVIKKGPESSEPFLLLLIIIFIGISFPKFSLMCF